MTTAPSAGACASTGPESGTELCLTAEPVAARFQTDVRLRNFIGSALFPVLTAILSALIIWSVFTGGVRRGMDHAIAWGPESENAGIAIAISELLHGLDSYVGYAVIAETLNKVMKRGTSGPADPKLPSNLKDGDLINEAIAAAVALGPQSESFIAHRSLMTMVYDDIGIVDYDKIAFSLFGFTIQSLYYLFFAILSLSSAVFLLQFWRNPVAQVVLLCTLSAFYMELDSLVFSQHLPSFWGMRHGSTLALVPVWHLALLMVYRSRLSLMAVIFAVVQVAILVLAVRIRGSAAWTVIFMAALALFFAVQAWREFGPGERSVAKVAKSALRWPFILLLIGLFSSKIYTDGKLHQAYFTDDIMPYHGAWHSAYLGLAASPTLSAATGAATTDRAGYDAALAYLRKKGFISSEAEYISPWTATYKMRFHDNTMRAVYLSVIKEHPFSTLALYLYWKPRQIYYAMQMVLDPIPITTWLAALLGAMALAAATVLVQRTATEARNVVLLGFAAMVFSSLPNMWAYASYHAVADLTLSILVFVILGAWTIWLKLIPWLWSRSTNLRRRSAIH
jgi:hypothetical protein